MTISTESQPQKSAHWVWTDVGITDLATFFLKAIVALIPVSIIVAIAALTLMALVRSMGH